MVPVDLFDIVSPQTFNLQEMQYLQSTVEQSTINKVCLESEGGGKAKGKEIRSLWLQSLHKAGTALLRAHGLLPDLLSLLALAQTSFGAGASCTIMAVDYSWD